MNEAISVEGLIKRFESQRAAGGRPLGTASGGDVALLAVVSAAMLAGSMWVLSRRDLTR